MSDVTWNPAGDDDTSFGPLTAHNVLGGRTAADAHPAAAVSYDHTVSGLTGDTVQDVIDELASGGGGGAVDSVNGETGVVVLDAADVGAVPVEAVGLLPGETNRGMWDIATAYVAGDVIFYGGGGYVALGATTGDQPDVSPGAWDPIDPSTRQVAVGPGSSASGYAAVAVGYGSSASGYAAVAVGPGSSASGDGAFAVGLGSSASGDGAVNLAHIVTGAIDINTVEVTALTLPGGFVDLPETAAVTNPAADHQRLVARTDGLYVRDQAGTEVGPLGAGGGGGIPETIIDAAGDLIVGTAADTAGRLALGAAGTVLTSTGSAAGWQATRHGLTIPLPSAIGFHRRIGANVSMIRGTVWWIRIPEIAHDAKATHVWIDTATGVSSCTATGAIVSTTTAGKPGTVLASTAVGAIDMSVSSAMNGAALSSPYTLTTGGNYWVAVLALGGASDPTVRGADGVEGWLNVNVGTAPVTPAVNNTYGSLRLTGQASIPGTPAAVVGTVTPVVYLSVEAP